MATDAHSDLHTPLFPREKGLALITRLIAGSLARYAPRIALFNRLGGSVLAVFALFLVGWVVFTEDKLGGEPQAQTAIQIAIAPTNARPGSDAGQPLPPAQPGIAQPGVAPGEPQILRVPQVERPGGLDTSAQGLPPAPVPAPAGTADSGPRFDARGGLADVANPSLVQRFDANSFVPLLGPSGERALDAYARPLEAGTVAQGQPRIALIVGGLGLSQTSTQEVLNRLPGATTLSFAPYGNSLARWASRARELGHEYLIELPMEPFDYPNNDPGPHTLQVGLESAANLERLHWTLSRLPTPIGFMNYMGGRFASEEAAVRPIVADTVARGLMVVDDGRSARSRMVAVAGDGAPVVRADVVIDARADAQAINSRLSQLEAIARERGSALGVATALPLTITTLEEWTASLAAKGIALVPVSSLVRF